MINKHNYLFFLIISSIILFLFLFKFFYLDYNENFNSSILFLSKDETKNFILKDEDNYIKNLSVYDLKARKVKTNDEYLFKASNSSLEFSKEQKEKIIKCYNEANRFFKNNINCVFALVSDNYEEGFPHTRANIIFLSPLILNYIDTELTKTIIHENIHIYQRYNKSEIEKYLKDNNFKISRLRRSVGLIRANPDLDEFIYMNKEGKEMMATYKNENPSGIGDIAPISLLNEHPFEYMAYTVAEKYIQKILSKYNNIK